MAKRGLAACATCRPRPKAIAGNRCAAAQTKADPTLTSTKRVVLIPIIPAIVGTTAFTPDRVIPLATVPLAQLKAGSQISRDGLPRGLTLQYGRLKYTVSGTAPTTGKITAGVVAGVQSNGVAI